jgi:DNA polymerase-4
MSSGRKIIHVDMDCFYAAVEQRDRPALRGLPIAVGGSPEGRGVIATASYEARPFGVRSAIASATAIRLCPQLIIVRPDFSKYKKESRRVREIMLSYGATIEPLSLDEAYLDVSNCRIFDGSATRIAQDICQRIKTETGLTASAGVAPNKFLAKIASDINKPDGIKVIRPHEIDAFMKTLPIEKIWGVGKVTAAKMHQKGIRTCADLQRFSVEELTHMYGSWGAALYDYARGIDDRPVRESRERKSLSVEETYFSDLVTIEQCLEHLPELYDDWNERMVRSGHGARIRGISVKLKFNDFKSLTHDRVFEGYPKYSDFHALFLEAYARKPEPVRLLGVGARLETSAPERERATPQMRFDLASE